MGDGVPLFEVLEVEVGGDLAELVVLVEELVDLVLVGELVDLVGGVELLDVVYQPQQAVYLLLVLQLGLLVAAQVHRLLHHPSLIITDYHHPTPTQSYRKLLPEGPQKHSKLKEQAGELQLRVN